MVRKRRAMRERAALGHRPRRPQHGPSGDEDARLLGGPLSAAHQGGALVTRWLRPMGSPCSPKPIPLRLRQRRRRRQHRLRSPRPLPPASRRLATKRVYPGRCHPLRPHRLPPSSPRMTYDGSPVPAGPHRLALSFGLLPRLVLPGLVGGPGRRARSGPRESRARRLRRMTSPCAARGEQHRRGRPLGVCPIPDRGMVQHIASRPD